MQCYWQVKSFRAFLRECSKPRRWLTASEVCPVVLRGYLTTYANIYWVIGQVLSSGVLRGFLSDADVTVFSSLSNGYFLPPSSLVSYLPLSLLGGLCVLAEAYGYPHATDNSILASISSNTNIESSYEVGGQKISNRWSCINFKLYCQMWKLCAFALAGKKDQKSAASSLFTHPLQRRFYQHSP